MRKVITLLCLAGSFASGMNCEVMMAQLLFHEPKFVDSPYEQKGQTYQRRVYSVEGRTVETIWKQEKSGLWVIHRLDGRRVGESLRKLHKSVGSPATYPVSSSRVLLPPPSTEDDPLYTAYYIVFMARRNAIEQKKSGEERDRLLREWMPVPPEEFKTHVQVQKGSGSAYYELLLRLERDFQDLSIRMPALLKTELNAEEARWRKIEKEIRRKIRTGESKNDPGFRGAEPGYQGSPPTPASRRVMTPDEEKFEKLPFPEPKTMYEVFVNDRRLTNRDLEEAAEPKAADFAILQNELTQSGKYKDWLLRIQRNLRAHEIAVPEVLDREIESLSR